MSFSEEVYAQIREGCQRSAAVVVPQIVDLLEPETVVDVGGGEGWWGIEFSYHNAMAVVLDESYPEGDPVEVDVGEMEPGQIAYRHVKLATHDAQMVPIPPRGMYDLAVCLEVGEHLAEEYAAPLVNKLCQLAPQVLFSAAIPHQGGHGHVNEQWPGYWAMKFLDNGLVCGDLRRRFWHQEQIEPWYRQNLLLFAPQARLARLGIPEIGYPMSLVHPDIYGWRVLERDEARGL